MKNAKHLRYGLAIVTASIIGLSGCGGGGGGDTVTGSGLVIIYHYPADVCESPELLVYLEEFVPQAYNYDISVASNDVTCATYNKTAGIDCDTYDFAEDPDNPYQNPYDINTSCVVGFDYTYSTKELSVNEDIALEASYAVEVQR